MNAMNATSRLGFLDVVSGVMVVHMIVGHALQRCGLWNNEEYWYWDVRTWLFFFMPWFYFKAGLFVSRRRGVKESAVKDAWRLLVPMGVWTVVGSVVANVIEMMGDEPRVWWKVWFGWPKEIVMNGSAHGGLQLWFLLSLFWVKMVYRLLPARGEWLAMVVATGVGWLLWRGEVQLWLSWSSVFPGLVMLLVGAKVKASPLSLFQGEGTKSGKLRIVAGGVKV